MKYIKLFEEFIAEGGHIIDNVRPINQNEVMSIIKFVEKNIFPQIGLKALDDDAALVGSAGKKSIDQHSGDIDIAVSADKIAGFLGVSIQNIIYALNDKLKDLGYQTKIIPGFNQISIAVPINGDKKNGFAQVDFMITTNLDWSRFIYYSPDFRIAESRYKAAYRNILLMSTIGQCFKKIIATTDTGEIKEFETYVVRLNQGIVQVRKTFEGKNGLVKTAQLMKEFDKFITNTPEEIVKLLFNGNHSTKEIMTYENLKQLIDSKDFKFPEKREAIYKEFTNKLINTHLPLPEEI